MFFNPLLHLLLLLVSYLPSLASSRSIPIPARDVARTEPVKVQTAHETDNSYARTLKLKDGSLLLGYTHFNSTSRTLEISRSLDDGQSFEPYGHVLHRDSFGDIDNIFLIEVGSTTPPTVLAAFRNHDKNQDGQYTHFRITICRSLDGGKTWRYISQAVEYSAGSTGGWGVWEPFMRHGDDGKIHLTYSGELSANNQQTFRTISEDGKYWSEPVDLQVHKDSEELRDGMQGIAKVKDQKTGRDALVMVFETTRRGDHKYNIEYAISYDDGATYVKRGNVYTPVDGKQAGSPQIVCNDNGRLAVLFMTDESMSTQSWPGIAQIKSVTSTGLKDGVVEWTTAPRAVAEGNSHWPGLLGMDGNILGTYEINGDLKAEFIDIEN